MLMLQRAAENVNPSECNDPAVLLACSLGSDSCPAACQKKADDENSDTEKKDTNRVIAGDLDISVVDYSSSVKSAPQGIFVANTLKFNASEKIQLDSLTLKRSGLGSQKSISKVWLEKNGVAVTNSASVSSDGLAVLNFKSNRDTISEATEYQLVVELNQGTQYQGDEFAFELKSAESTAKNTTISGTTTTYRVSNYQVVELTARVNAYNASTTEYDLGNASDYIIWEFSLESDSKSDDRDIYVKSLTFRNAGDLNFEDTFKNIVVYRDSKIVSKNVEINGKDITISLDKDTIKANRKAIYTIRAEVATLEDVGKTVQLTLQNTRDIIADEEDTSFRATISYIDPATQNPATSLTLNSYKFKGWKVTFESTSSFAKTVNAGIGSTDVVIAKGKLNVTEPVELPDLVIPYGTNWWQYAVGGVNSTLTASSSPVTLTTAIKRLVLKVGDKRYTADPANDGSFTFSDVVVRETSDVELLISLGSKVENGATITLPNIAAALIPNGKVWSYQNNDAQLKKTDIAGVIQTADVIVKTPKFAISSKNIDTQETVKNDSSVKTLMEGTLQAKENDVNVNSFVVTLVADGNAGNDDTVEIYLDIDGKSFANSNSISLKNGGSYSFNSLGTIKVGDSLPFALKVVPTVATEGVNIVLKAQAKGTDSNGNDAATSEEYSATLEVKWAATIEVLNTSSISDRVVEPTANATLYQGELNVKNGSTTLQWFAITNDANVGNALSISDYRLYVDGDLVASNNADPTFTSLTENLNQGKRKIEVKANVQAATTNTTVKTASKCIFNGDNTTDVPSLADEAACKAKAVYKSANVCTFNSTDVNVTAAANDDDCKALAVFTPAVYNSASANDFLYKVDSIAINGWTPVAKTANTYFAKGYFTLSKTSTSDSVLTVKLTNTSSKTIDISWISIDDGKSFASASINDQDVTGIDKTSATAQNWTVSPQSVAAGDSIEIQLIAAKDSTVKLTGISYSVTDGNKTYSYTVDNKITSIGSWWKFFSSK